MTYLEKAIKVTEEFDNKNLSIKEWVESILGAEYINYYSEEYYRRAENIFSLFVKKLNQEELNGLSFDIVKQIKEAKEELEKEKIKLRQEKNELSEKYRYNARTELFEERIIEAIVYTLTSIENVNYVIIYMEGEILTKLPQSKITLPSTLDRSIGINKEYNITSKNNIHKTTIYYVSKFNDNTYYVPVTKINNGI